MEKALILTGKEETSQGRVESYQLLIDRNYLSTIYDGSSERDLFIEEASSNFSDRILEEDSVLEVGVFNGLRINPQTGSRERIQKLEDEFVSQFSERVCAKLMPSNRGIPVSSRN